MSRLFAVEAVRVWADRLIDLVGYQNQPRIYGSLRTSSNSKVFSIRRRRVMS